MSESTKGAVTLVGTGNSKRLDAIRKKAGLAINSQPEAIKKDQYLIEGLNRPTKEALLQAGSLIEDRFAAILKTYPPGKTKSYFKIKYGMDIKQVKTLSIEEMFKILQLDSTKVKQFRLIASLDFSGKALLSQE